MSDEKRKPTIWAWIMAALWIVAALIGTGILLHIAFWPVSPPPK